VPYREELEAALGRVAAAEDALAAARDENAHDHERIAELEKQLAEARTHATVAETPRPDPPARPRARSSPDRAAWRTPWMLVPFAIVLVIGADALIKHANKSNPGGPKIDIMTELTRAKADARRHAPDAVLLKMETQSIDMVDLRGVADLSKGFMTFDFFSPSHESYVHVLFMQGGLREVTELRTSGLRVHDPPRCSVVDVWAEAIRRGASPSSLASIRLGKDADEPMWTFEIRAPGHAFVMTLPDECPSHS
jgi:hypothetical protein